MRADAIVFGIAGSLFGLIIGWVLGSQQATRSGPVAAPVAQAAPAQQASAPPQPAPIDPARVTALQDAGGKEPEGRAAARAAGQHVFRRASSTRRRSRGTSRRLRINPRDPNVSTDLGVAYYYTNQPDRALAQFDKSLAVDPKHIKTLLNIGIVRAFGKQDLAGAGKAWQQVVDLVAGFSRGSGGEEGPRRHQERAGRRSEVRLWRAFSSCSPCSSSSRRTFWRFVDAIVRGASGPAPQGGPPLPVRRRRSRCRSARCAGPT